MSAKVFMIAGESSGDVLGAGLMRALQQRVPIEVTGVGGPLMEKEGLRSLYPMSKLCVMGLFEILKHAPRLLKLVKTMVLEIERQNPDILVTIDLPDFNFRVAKLLKKRGNVKTQIIHYVAPTVWAWRPGRAAKITRFLDGLICLFPFEPPYFTKHGLRAAFAGHPLVENAARGDGAAFRRAHNISENVPTLGLFFGSRHGEFETIQNTFKDTIRILKMQYPGLHLIVPTLEHLEKDVRLTLEDIDCPAHILTDSTQKWQAFAAMDAGLAMSGTIGLELAYAGVPHVIAYKANPISWAIFTKITLIRFAHLANIMMDRAIVPEYLQERCNATAIARGLIILLNSAAERSQQIEQFRKIAGMLGADNKEKPSSRAADFVLSFAEKDQSRLATGT